jgi:hypothetical protein
MAGTLSETLKEVRRALEQVREGNAVPRKEVRRENGRVYFVETTPARTSEPPASTPMKVP